MADGAGGEGRASHRSFFPHHLAALSAAIVTADAQSIRITHGM